MHVKEALEATDSTGHGVDPNVTVHPDANPVPVTVTLLPPAVLTGALVFTIVTPSCTPASAMVIVMLLLEATLPQTTTTGRVPAVRAGVVHLSVEPAASTVLDVQALAPMAA